MCDIPAKDLAKKILNLAQKSVISQEQKYLDAMFLIINNEGLLNIKNQI